MICKKIMSIMFEFWWSTKRETSGIYWKIWDQLRKNKGKGGLGFRVFTTSKSSQEQVLCKIEPLTCKFWFLPLLFLEKHTLGTRINETRRKSSDRQQRG
ncbi:unnamed protein product [Brassica rapa]|uniref:Uncharacterized protein n=1 Tax=Brassica campestris TaxID=3711 RepID=A0A8D9GYQ8_BRACM|nr:unnamed protein product [Brassica rapa]